MHCSAVFLADTIEAFWANVFTDVWIWIKENPSDIIPIIIVAVVPVLLVFLAVLCTCGLIRFSSFVARVLGEQFCKDTQPPSDKIPLNTFYTRKGYEYLAALLILWFLFSRVISLFVRIGLWRFLTIYAFLVLATYVLLVVDSAIPLFQKIIDLIKKLIIEPAASALKVIGRIGGDKENKRCNGSTEETEQDQPPCEGGKEQP